MAHTIVQNQRTPPIIVIESRYAFRYVGDRSADSRRNNQPGQDFIAFTTTPDHLSFVLCDGVSQSFLGDLGARLIGEALLHWLENDCQGSSDISTLQISLKKYLISITSSATAQVADQILPDNLPNLLKEVLDEKRSLGSQSMFIGVRIDLPGDQFPHGRLICAWMGDSRLRIWGPDRERTEVLGNQFLTEQRWSTLSGLVNGNPHIFTDSLYGERGKPKYSRILAYSDGFAVLDTIQESLTNAQLENYVDQLAELPNSDDVSLFEFWLGQSPVGLDLPLSAPVGIQSAETHLLEKPPLFSHEEENASTSPPVSSFGIKTPSDAKPRSSRRAVIWIPVFFGAILLIVFIGSYLVGVLRPTPTSTPTVTITFTPSKTSTLRPTNTSTKAPTYTPSPTLTLTFTATITITATPTFTLAPTNTIHPSPSPTSTPIISNTSVSLEGITPISVLTTTALPIQPANGN